MTRVIESVTKGCVRACACCGRDMGWMSDYNYHVAVGELCADCFDRLNPSPETDMAD